MRRRVVWSGYKKAPFLFSVSLPKTCPHPPPKTARVGEVGWGVTKLPDNSLLKSGNQIKVITEWL